jgi:hypothetical protein
MLLPPPPGATNSLSVLLGQWPPPFLNARLCKATLDRLTGRAHIIETGAESYRFRRTV